MAHYNKNVWLKFHSFVVIVWQNLRFFGNFYLHCIMQMLISHEVIVCGFRLLFVVHKICFLVRLRLIGKLLAPVLRPSGYCN